MTPSDLTTGRRSDRRIGGRLRRMLPALILVVACGGEPVWPAPKVAGRTISDLQDRGEGAVVEELGRGDEPDRQVREFARKVMPDPPNQGAPWTPPATKLPRSLVEATALLFESGVADPRGCDYREIEVEERGNCRLSCDGQCRHCRILAPRRADLSRTARI